MSGFYQEFLAGLALYGVSKTSHFQVSIPVTPTGVNSSFSASGRLLALRCEATDLPGRQVATQDNRIYGPVYKTPYQAIYQSVTLNFLETSDLFVRRFFETWLEIVLNSTRNQLSYPNSYRQQIIITQFDVSPKTQDIEQTTGRGGIVTTPLKEIMSWHLTHAFPSAINQMPLSWTEDGFHRVSVTMEYEYYILSRPDEPKKELKTKGSTNKQRKGSATN